MSEGLFAARYRLPLRAPIVVVAQTLTHRDGYLLRRSRDGEDRYADLCPLPGLSREALDDAAEALRSGASLPPSATWALAATELDGAEVETEAARLLHFGDPAPPDARVLKLKVGRASLDDEVSWVADVARASSAALRLDGNQRLTLAGARRLAEAAGDRLEFLEEPVARAALHAALASLPIALDESLLDGEPMVGARAWVLKPTVLGAERTNALLRAAERAGVCVIISSAYESAVGRRALARLARVVAPGVVHGLGTGPAFARDISMVPLEWERWR